MDLARRIDGILDQPSASADVLAYRESVSAFGTDPLSTVPRLPPDRADLDLLGAVLPALEVSRWDADPTLLDRNYWRNSVAVRARLPGLATAAADDTGFLRNLRRLQVIYLMGEELDSHYVPGSASRLRLLTDLDTGPGALRRRRVRCSAKSKPAMAYYHRLSQSLGGEDGADNTPPNPAGLSWGRCTWMKSRSGQPPIHVFVPPEEILPGHVRALRERFGACLRARESGDDAAVVAALGRFLHCFVCLHPFGCGNYGLAMNIVNWLLRESVGGYLPHLHLDCCAHRLPAARFGLLFQRAIDQFLVLEGNPDSVGEALDRIDRLKRELDDPMFPADGAPAEPGDFAAELDALLA